MRIPNNCVNFVVRLQAKGQRIANQRLKDCKPKTKKKTKIRHSYEYEDISNQRLASGQPVSRQRPSAGTQAFPKWLLEQIAEQKPDALLIAGDIFDNGNPSAAAQTVYYEFLADATQLCPNMQVIITAGNHDSASRLEAPRPLLTRYHVEIRGNVRKSGSREKARTMIKPADIGSIPSMTSSSP